MAWYQQTQGQELTFLIQKYEQMEGGKGNLPSRFSVQQFSDYHSEMNMSALELEDSAVYFCASSPVLGGATMIQLEGVLLQKALTSKTPTLCPRNAFNM